MVTKKPFCESEHEHHVSFGGGSIGLSLRVPRYVGRGMGGAVLLLCRSLLHAFGLGLGWDGLRMRGCFCARGCYRLRKF